MLETDKKWIIFAIATTLLLFIIGGFIFLKDVVYYEREQLYYISLYTALALLSFVLMARQKFILFGVVVAVMAGILGFSTLKYDWRKNFITATDYGQKPILLERIDRYPSFEAHLISRFQKEPNWIGFTNDCLTPALSGQTIETTCLNSAVVMSEYGIDIDAEIEDQYQRMSYTVQQIERGRIKNDRQYRGCVASKRCAPVPLLPQGVKADEIDPRSEDHLEVRQLFWQIAAGGELSREVCVFNQLCNAVMKAGIVTPRSVAEIEEERTAR